MAAPLQESLSLEATALFWDLRHMPALFPTESAIG